MDGEKRRELLYRSAMVVAFFVLWHVGALLYDSIYFPGPLGVLDSLLALFTVQKTYTQFWISFRRVYISLGIAMLVGTVLGVIPRYSTLARYAVTTVIHPLLQAVPAISWVFLVLIWMGLSPVSPIFILVVVMLPVVVLNTFEGMKELDPDLTELGHSFTGSRWKVFRSIQFPQVYPYLFSALKHANAVGWKVVLVAELFVATNGIGNEIRLASSMYNISKVMAWTAIIVGVVILFEYGIFRYLDKKTMRQWQQDGGGDDMGVML